MPKLLLSDIKVGQLLKVRTWDNLLSEFQLRTKDGGIDCLVYFNKDMAIFCGATCEVMSFRGSTYMDIKFIDQELESKHLRWTFTYDMFTYASPPKKITLIYPIGKVHNNFLITQEMVDIVNRAKYYIQVSDDVYRIGDYYFPKDALTITEIEV